jgi:O-antigen/teichoic acid export membrane protein
VESSTPTIRPKLDTVTTSAPDTVPKFGMKRLGQHSLIYAAGFVLNRTMAFVLLPLYTHYLSPADYGIMQLVELTLDIVAIFAGSQIASGVFRFYHKADSESERKAVLSTAMIVLVLSFAAFATGTAIAAPMLSEIVFDSPEHALLLQLAAASLGLQSLIIVPLSYIRLQQRSIQFTYITAGKLLLQVTLNIVFLVVLHLGVTGILLSTVLTNLTVGVALAAPFVRQVGLHFSGKWTRALLRYGIPLVAVNVATFVSTYGDRYFLRASADMTVVGLYALAYQFGFLLYSLAFTPFALVWEPVRFEIAKRSDRDEIFNRAFLYLNVVLISIGVGISLFVGEFLDVMSAPEFLPAADIVPIILLAYVLQGWATFHEVGLLVTERTEFVTVANWLAAGMAVAAYAAFIPRWLGYGAAIATVLAFGVRFLATYRASQRLWFVQYHWSPVLRLSTLAVLFCAVSAAMPRMHLAVAIPFHVALYVAYVLAIWHARVLSFEDRRRILGFIRSPRRAAAELLT